MPSPKKQKKVKENVWLVMLRGRSDVASVHSVWFNEENCRYHVGDAKNQIIPATLTYSLPSKKNIKPKKS